MKVLIVSLNFNPGHFSHLIANYKLLDGKYSPYLYINSAFNNMTEAEAFNIINKPINLKKNKPFTFAIFWFPSLKNVFEILRLKLFYHSKIIYVFHEPFDSIKNYYNAGFRALKIIKICLINLVNLPVLMLSNHIILPSSNAVALFKQKYLYLNKSYTYMPLLFDDEAAGMVVTTAKIYIAYIGTVAKDHAFDKFIDFVKTAVEHHWFPDLEFLIATKSKLSLSDKNKLQQAISLKKISIFEGKVMTNNEINAHYNKSLVVWNAYNRSMQSGVLPKAYMFGAAVITLQRNSNEFIDNHHTGVLITANDDALEIKAAIEEIYENSPRFIENCRKKFLQVFFLQGSY